MPTRADYLDALWGDRGRRTVAAYPELVEPDRRREQSRPPVGERVQPSRQWADEGLDLGPTPPAEHVDFPVDVLPRAIRDYVLDVARSKEVEPEMVIIPTLVALGAAIGNSRRIALKADWSESAMLWATVVARPGSVKTHVIDEVLSPLQDYEDDLADSSERAWETYKRDIANWERKRADERGDRPPEPWTRRQVVNETTTEELAYILRDNPRGLLMVQDELTTWVGGMNQYKGGKGNDRSRWLSFWSGQRLSVDRRAEHGHPVRVRRPFVAVVGGLQPEKVRSLRPEDGADDGFIDRILFSWPADRVRQWREDTIDEYTRGFYAHIFDNLLLLNMQPEPSGRGARPFLLGLNEDAHTLWVDFYNAHHQKMAEPSFDPRLHGAFAKLDGYAARLALILHLTREAAGEVEGGTLIEVTDVIAAWMMVDYFVAGATRVYGQMELTPDDRRVVSALDWMRKHKTQTISARDCTTFRIAGVHSGSEVKSLFRALVDRGYGLATEESGDRGGRRRLIFRLSGSEWTDEPVRDHG